jgi:hypothetical protein
MINRLVFPVLVLISASALAATAQPPPPPPVVQSDDQSVFWVPGGPESYGRIFESILQVVISHGFEIQVQDTNRYSGHVETLPRIAPGLGLFLKPGNHSFYDRLLFTLQTYRHRVAVDIDPGAPPGCGYFIKVTAIKELEDLARPVRATAGAAIFRNNNNVDRTFEVIDATVVDSHWIPKGRDQLLEGSLIKKLKKCM